MRGLHNILPLLFLCLILLPFQLHYATTSSTFQEKTTGSFKVSTSAYDLRNKGGSSQKFKRNRKEAYEKKVRKAPSGPSPVGNNRPPSKA